MNETTPPLVSIRCITYNHGKYIRDALEGFIMQKTNFKFEAIVHDDASTDNTAIIIQEYAKKYPDIIKPIFETENQYSKHDGSLTRIMYAACKGKYIAYCEGDDFWTDPYKLQKQVDFLENHPDYVMCSHRYHSYNETKQIMLPIIRPINTNPPLTYSLNDLIEGKWLFHPLTVMYRRQAFILEDFLKYGMSYDVIRFYHLLKSGKGYLLPDIMATYRIHENGIWSKLKQEEQFALELKQRVAIYNIEKNRLAADLIFNVIMNRPFSRKWLIKNRLFIKQIMIIIYKQKGLRTAFKVFHQLFIHI